jgi:hypothetical protein
MCSSRKVVDAPTPPAASSSSSSLVAACMRADGSGEDEAEEADDGSAVMARVDEARGEKRRLERSIAWRREGEVWRVRCANGEAS